MGKKCNYQVKKKIWADERGTDLKVTTWCTKYDTECHFDCIEYQLIEQNETIIKLLTKIAEQLEKHEYSVSVPENFASELKKQIEEG